jgi:hypothetical protein
MKAGPRTGRGGTPSPSLASILLQGTFVHPSHYGATEGLRRMTGQGESLERSQSPSRPRLLLPHPCDMAQGSARVMRRARSE